MVNNRWYYKQIILQSSKYQRIQHLYSFPHNNLFKNITIVHLVHYMYVMIFYLCMDIVCMCACMHVCVCTIVCLIISMNIGCLCVGPYSSAGILQFKPVNFNNFSFTYFKINMISHSKCLHVFTVIENIYNKTDKDRGVQKVWGRDLIGQNLELYMQYLAPNTTEIS